MTLEVKWVPRSESTERGKPQRLNTWFSNRTVVIVAVVVIRCQEVFHPLGEGARDSEEVFITRDDLGTGAIQSMWR